MKTSVCQSLVDSGDPLALAMVAQGASTFQLVPVSEWVYSIWKVTYGWGPYEEEYTLDELKAKAHRTSEWYMLDTNSHIGAEASRYSPNDAWHCWEPIEELERQPPKRHGFGDYDEFHGWGKYKTISELKHAYRI